MKKIEELELKLKVFGWNLNKSTVKEIDLKYKNIDTDRKNFPLKYSQFFSNIDLPLRYYPVENILVYDDNDIYNYPKDITYNLNYDDAYKILSILSKDLTNK